MAFAFLAGIAAAASRFSDNFRWAAAGSKPGNYGLFRGDAARTAIRQDRRHYRDDVLELSWSTSITLQFDLNRDINGAARDVQAAINAARSYLPANLPSNPTYRKVNPADAPIMIFALTSDVYDQGGRCTTPPRRSWRRSFRRSRAWGSERRRKFAAGGARRAQSHRT